MDEYEQGGDFDCEIRIKDGQIVQLKMAGGTFKVANPFGIGRLDTILKAFSLIDSLGLIPSEKEEEPERNEEGDTETHTPERESKSGKPLREWVCGKCGVEHIGEDVCPNPPKEPAQPSTGTPTTGAIKKSLTQPTKPAQKESPTKAEQPEKTTRKGPPKGTGGRPPKYSDEVKQRVLELFGQKKKPQAIQKIILDEQGIEVNRNMMHKWRQEQGIRDSGEEETVCETVEKIEKALGREPDKEPGPTTANGTPVELKESDLKTEDGRVRCPETDKEKDADLCGECRGYITQIYSGNERYIRCTKV